MLKKLAVLTFLGLILFALPTSNGFAQPSAMRVLEKQSAASGLRYLLFLPGGYAESGENYPLILSLHGFSLRGDNLETLKTYGLPQIAENIQNDFPFILVAPQLPRTRLAWRSNELMTLLEDVKRETRIDATRVYLTGLSLGAAGAYSLAIDNPEKFAAIVPVSGAGDLRRANLIKNLGVWIFHGENDRTVPLARAQAMVDALRSTGANPSLTIFPGVGHDPLTRETYVDSGVLNWLQQFSTKTNAPEISEPPTNSSRVRRLREDAKRLKNQLPDFPANINVPNNNTIFSWIEGLTAVGEHRRPGTAEGRRGEVWVKNKFQQLGLQSVAEDRLAIPVWEPRSWSLRVGSEQIPVNFMPNMKFTAPGGVDAPLVFAGKGSETDFRRVDARGKIAVVEADIADAAKTPELNNAYFISDSQNHLTGTTYSVNFPRNNLGAFAPNFDGAGANTLVGGLASGYLARRDAYRNAKKAGAVGLVMVLKNYCGSAVNSFYFPYDGEIKDLPGLYVSERDGASLIQLARAGRTANLRLEGTVTNGEMRNIYGVLPGASDDVILITSHHDSTHRGAVEDASGVAQVLAQISAWRQIPQSQRPKTLVFVAAAGHFFKGQGSYEFAKRHPEIVQRTKAVVTLEHFPAKEVREGEDGGYVETGKPQAATINVSANAKMIAAVWKSFEREAQPSVMVTTPAFNLPLTDVAGYLSAAREQRRTLPYISWISAPCYLVDEYDTLDKIERERLQSAAQTVTETIKNLMMTNL